MPQSKWKENLLRMFELEKNLRDEPKLRHDLSFIRAGDIGAQRYCELKVEFKYKMGKVETTTIRKGRELHSELVEGLPSVSFEEAISRIESGDLYHLAELPLLAEVKGVPLGGVPDNVIFHKAKPVLVADLRTTSREKLWIGLGKFTQIEMYGLLLDSIGFDCSKLRLMVGVEHADIREKLGYSPYDQDLLTIYLLLEEGRGIEEVEELLRDEIEEAEKLSEYEYHRRIYQYDSQETLDIFEWAKDYWLSKRDLEPAAGSGMCKSCEYYKNCPRSLRGMGKVFTKRLVNSGFTSVEKIASEDSGNIDRKTRIGPRRVWELLLSAKAIVSDKIFQIDDFVPPKDPLYLDVETTPNERFMTGIYYSKEDEFKQFTVKRWTANERRKIGRALQRFLVNKGKTLVTYTNYDTRFLSSKMLEGKEHYDLYRRLRKSFVLPSQDYKLSSVGKVFGYNWGDPTITGRDVPALYENYQMSGKESYMRKIEEHNKDDVMAMVHIVQDIEKSEFEYKNFEEEIAKRLNELASRLGRAPEGKDYERIYGAAKRYLGSWEKAKKMLV